jgi:hypothetical protein
MLPGDMPVTSNATVVTEREFRRKFYSLSSTRFGARGERVWTRNRKDAREERELASDVAKALANEMAGGSYGASDLSNTEKHLYRRTTGMLFSPRL